MNALKLLFVKYKNIRNHLILLIINKSNDYVYFNKMTSGLKTLFSFFFKVANTVRILFIIVVTILILLSFSYLIGLVLPYLKVGFVEPANMDLFVFFYHLVLTMLFFLFFFIIARVLSRIGFIKNIFSVKKLILPILLLILRLLCFLINTTLNYVFNKQDVFINIWNLFSVEFLFSKTPTSFVNTLTAAPVYFSAINENPIYLSACNFVTGIKKQTDLIDFSAVYSFFWSDVFFDLMTLFFVCAVGVCLYYALFLYDISIILPRTIEYGVKLKELMIYLSSFNWTIMNYRPNKWIRHRLGELLLKRSLNKPIQYALYVLPRISKSYTPAEISAIISGTLGASYMLYGFTDLTIIKSHIFRACQQFYNFFVWRYGSDLASERLFAALRKTYPNDLASERLLAVIRATYGKAYLYARPPSVLPLGCTVEMMQEHMLGNLPPYVPPIPTQASQIMAESSVLSEDEEYLFDSSSDESSSYEASSDEDEEDSSDSNHTLTQEDFEIFSIFRDSLDQFSLEFDTSNPEYSGNFFLNSEVPSVNLEADSVSNSSDFNPSSSSSNLIFDKESIVNGGDVQEFAPVDNPDPYNMAGLLASLDNSPALLPGSVVETVAASSNLSNQSISTENTPTSENAAETQPAIVSDCNNLPTPESVGGGLLLHIGLCVAYVVVMSLIKNYVS